MRQATVKPEQANRGKGEISQAGLKADEIVELLRANGYEVKVKKLVPKGEEATLELAITYGVERSLFEAAEVSGGGSGRSARRG